MVTTKSIRKVSRRLLLAMLASAGAATLNADLASAQSKVPVSTNASGPATFSMNDIKLAPGETLVGPATIIGDKSIQHNGGSYQIIDAATASTLTSQLQHEPVTSDIPMMTQPQIVNGYAVNNYAGVSSTGGCSSCGNTGCSSCSGGGYGGYQGYNTGKLGMGGNACGPICNPYLYTSVEALYMTNNQVGNYSLSPNFGLSDYDYQFGIRAFVGIVPDCRNGMEFGFIGPFNWTQNAVLNGPGIGTFLFPQAPVTAANLAPFSNATQQTQNYDTEYFSLEANRTLIGWEICKFLIGMRYLDYKDDYLYTSTSAAGTGSLFSNATNRMIGAQIGAEMTYPLSCKLWSDFRGKAGVYGDFAETQVRLRTNTAAPLFLNNRDDDVEVAGLIEFGGGLRYYITDDLHIRGGAELWYLTGIATANSQFDNRVFQTIGRRTNTNDDVFMAGVNLGAELKF